MKVAGMGVTYRYFPFEMFLDSMARRYLPENRLPVCLPPAPAQIPLLTVPPVAGSVRI